MNHGKKLRKLNVYRAQRASLIRNMTVSLLREESVTTTEARAKEIVPVRSGNLMRSIFTEFKDDGLTAWIGPDYLAAPYGYYVEFGRSKSGKQPPYPFAGRHYMEGAFYQTKTQVQSMLETSIKRIL